MSGECALSDHDLWLLMVSEIGFIPSVRLLGWCGLWVFSGARHLVDVAGGEFGPHRSGAYRALADLRKVVAAMERAEGGDSARVDLLTLREIAGRLSSLPASRGASRGVLATF